MNQIKAKFRIKYGLTEEPTDEQIRKFIDELDKLIKSGREPEEAGEKAASLSFPSYGKVKYASQADTLHDLVLAISRKIKK